MDLAINGLRLMGQRHGVGRYIEYLLRHWGTIEQPFRRIRLYTPAKLADPVPLAGPIEHHILPTDRGNTFWEQVVLPRAHDPKALLFCPSYVVPFAARGRVVVTHLGSYEALPSAFPWSERIRAKLAYQLSAHRANRVITVSESSRQDMIRHYGLKGDKIQVIPLGVDPCFRPLEEPPGATQAHYFGKERPYLLFVGKLARRRNIPNLMTAFARVRERHNLPHGLLLIGQNSVGLEVAPLAQELGIADALVHREYAPHSELIRAYNAADLFVYPSSYEGFGIPVLEAMACGTPTIALANSAFLEFATAYLAQDGSVEALIRALEVVLFDRELRARMRVQGPLAAQAFGWERIAQATMTVLTQVAGLSPKN
ncbi:glycosyltransferase family 4 protein [Anthocerotibacter panamensis]|uniref:glycosyltransferase family 4 protein n=1 Tax=Anthocerotibacter panamensis TaxID=2857077 RepID=UPI001C402DF3|nr:glycosyltransferase family 1 protein [Anthocerotibacter panamensis]